MVACREEVRRPLLVLRQAARGGRPHRGPRQAPLRGGQNQDDNLLPACEYCNNLKANLTLSEWRKFVKMRVIRNLMSLGYISGDLSKIRITFFGEGNDSPYAY